MNITIGYRYIWWFSGVIKASAKTAKNQPVFCFTISFKLYDVQRRKENPNIWPFGSSFSSVYILPRRPQNSVLIEGEEKEKKLSCVDLKKVLDV